MMKCHNCGAELSEDAKFCSYCGAGTEGSSEPPPIPPEVEEANEPEEPREAYTYRYNAPPTSEPVRGTSKVKAKLLEIWSGLSVFGKIATIGIAVFAILGLAAFLAGRVFAGILAAVQLVLAVAAVLMKKQLLKSPNPWLPLAAMALSFLLIVPYFSLFRIDMKDYERYAWGEVLLADMLPRPESPYGEIRSNSEDSLSVTVTKTGKAQYERYIEACKGKGFTVDAETSGSAFNAYNGEGYELSLDYYPFSEEMGISLKAGMELGALVWPDSEMAKLLPTPESTVGNIQQDNEKHFSVYVGKTPIEKYDAYVKACEESGFTVDAVKTEKSYSAKNPEAYKLSVEYVGNNIVCISVDAPEFDVDIEIECAENWIFSKYDVDVSIDGAFKGTIPHGDKETYSAVLTKGTHTIGFESVEDDTLDGEVEVEISKNETLKFKISCSSFGIDVETIAGTTTAGTSEETSETPEEIITLTMSQADFKGMDSKEAEQKFREMGFTKFEHKTVETEDLSEADGTICYIEITEIFVGDSDFQQGDEFSPNSTITFYSYKFKEPEAPEPVFYSTNDYETAKKGNTGVFSYRERGHAYDIYWIIDFDEGYVYFFTEGNGNSECEKVKIDSGSLNDRIIITYHADGIEWSYGLHFKYVDHPETLIMQDNDGFEFEYSTTDLDEALKIRSTKTIVEY